jgi:hypothetical protein
VSLDCRVYGSDGTLWWLRRFGFIEPMRFCVQAMSSNQYMLWISAVF